MARMETDYSKHTYFRWKVKMATGAFGRARNCGLDGPLKSARPSRVAGPGSFGGSCILGLGLGLV